MFPLLGRGLTASGMMRRPVRLGLALSGGVALGLAHVGVLQVLDQKNISVSAIAGTSMGAIVGALYAGGIPSDWLEKLAKRIRWRHVTRVIFPRQGIVGTERIELLLDTLLRGRTFDQLQIPLAVVAVDLLMGREVVLREGRVAPAVRASSAIPGIFPPVEMGDMVLADGGIVNNVPVRPARDMGCDVVVAVDVGGRRRRSRPRNLWETMLISMEISQRLQVDRQLKLADVVIRPDLSGLSPLGLHQAEEMIARGREAALEKIEEIEALLRE